MWGFGGLAGMGRGAHMSHRFEEQYHCYSFVVADKTHLERGDKILLPPSAFDTLARLQVDYPMLFKLSSSKNFKVDGSKQHTHSGVLEFTAEEGTCYIPFWMMQNLLITEGDVITVTNASLPKATFVKLQPQSTDFLEISNPRAVLEHALRNYSCVTKDDIIQLPYNNKNYLFQLKEVKPADAACIIETDCNVDFDAPVGYEEPDYKKPAAAATSSAPSSGNGSESALSAASSATNTPSEQNGASNEIKDPLSSQKKKKKEKPEPSAMKIVNGVVVKNEHYDQEKQILTAKSKMLADKAGSTGIQRNAAIPQMAPEIDYWALQCGSGARLDGKTPAQLKDKSGNVLTDDDIAIRRQQREAALQAAEERARREASTLNRATNNPSVPFTEKPKAKQRKSRVGKKFSKLKQSSSAFQGSANKLN